MVHGILQFTPSIAFRYVLHRCKSRDIRCRESLGYVCHNAARTDTVSGANRGGLDNLDFLGAFGAGVLLLGQEETHTRRGTSDTRGDQGAKHL